jgi:stress response protein YsnF
VRVCWSRSARSVSCPGDERAPQPVDRAVADVGLGDQEIEVPLRGEQPVVEKQAVAKERVGIEKDVETERETVRNELRKERVEVDEDDRV